MRSVLSLDTAEMASVYAFVALRKSLEWKKSSPLAFSHIAMFQRSILVSQRQVRTPLTRDTYGRFR